MDNDDVQRIEQLAKRAIRKLQIPKSLHEDAMQQAWVVHLEGKKIITGLSAWFRKERQYHHHRKELPEEQPTNG